MDNKRYTFHSLFQDGQIKTKNSDIGRKLPPESICPEYERNEFAEKEVAVSISGIKIPRLQRDYAQGRQDEKIAQIREDFLNNLKEALINEGETCQLNFIYGQLEVPPGAMEPLTATLIPLDGQQRLTTLFLLHWYVSRKEKKSSEFPYLSDFLYDTRYSSTVFTTSFLNEITDFSLFPEEQKFIQEALETEAGWQGQIATELPYIPAKELKNNGAPGIGGVLSMWLCNKSKFAANWKKDSTICGMLVMLDAIHKHFHNVDNLFERLTMPASNSPIYFYFRHLPTETDPSEVFIKMNSRGKLLTEYEYFKADFVGVLKKHNYPQQAEISRKMDCDWEKSFWSYAKKCTNCEKLKSSDLDIYMIRFVNFIIDLIGFRKREFSSECSKRDYYDKNRLYKVIYTDDTKKQLDFANVGLLIDSIDCWSHLEDIHSYFSEKFISTSEGIVPGKIRLFSPKVPVQILASCFKGENISLDCKVLFQAIITALMLKDNSPEQFNFRFRSIQNLSFSMDKGIRESQYLLNNTVSILRVPSSLINCL